MAEFIIVSSHNSYQSFKPHSILTFYVITVKKKDGLAYNLTEFSYSKVFKTEM